MKIQIERTFEHPIDAVWTALTDPRAIRQWWVDTDFEPVAGRPFFLQDTPQGNWDGRVEGEVLEVDRPRRVAFRWRGGGHDTVVTYALEPTPSGGTRLALTHDGFVGVRGFVLSVMLRFGWGKLVGKLLPEMAGHVARVGIDTPFPTPPKADRARTA